MQMKSDKFALPKKSFILLIVGVLLMVVGFILMSGGGTNDPDIFPEAEMFSFRRVTLAPIFILAGFAVEIFAILYIPKKER